MLIVHANWTGGSLHLWGESLEACRGVMAAIRDEGPPVTTATVAATATTAATTTATTVPTDSCPPHPFAQGDEELAALLASVNGPSTGATRSSMQLTLPADGHRPLPSDRLSGIVRSIRRVGQSNLRQFHVPSLAVPNDRALSLMLAMESAGSSDAMEYGRSLRYWMDVARFVLELLADQRFIPTLIQARGGRLKAAWHPWFHDEAARRRVGAMLASMPPIVRAVVDGHEGHPWPILNEAICAWTNATVREALQRERFAEAVEDRDSADPHVAWLEGLLSTRNTVQAPADSSAEMLRDVARWIAALDDTGRGRTVRLCLHLAEPDPSTLREDLEPIGDNVRWRLSFHLMTLGEPSIRVEAAQIWRDPASAQSLIGGAVGSPEELLLGELGRAARIVPLLETALADASPAGIDLTTGQAYAFLTEHRELLEESGLVVEVPSWWRRPDTSLSARLQVDAPPLEPSAAAPPSAGSTAASESLLGLNSLVNYRWQVAVGDQALRVEELRHLVDMAKRGSLLRLRGRWVEVRPDQILEAAALFESQPAGQMTLLEVIQLAHGATGRQLGLPVYGMDAHGWVADLLGASGGDGSMPRLSQPEGFIGKLRPYQEIGLSWLMFLDRFGLGTCLADDMGLGKTIQLIALLLAERESSRQRAPIGPTLLVVPTSVIANWQREIARFGPSLTVHIHHGPDRPLGDHLLQLASEHDVIITTYTLVSRDRETLMRASWHRVVLDEAQYIKNPPTKQTATIRALQTTRRVAMTGTPVENRLSELWSIMEFCNPGYLGQAGEFRRRFAVPIERHRDQHRAEQLRRLVRPFVLRRLKTDPTVIDDLPACVTTKEYATLTGEQAQAYERAVSEMLGRVGAAAGIRRRGLVLATLVKLKQICNHPAQPGSGRPITAAPAPNAAEAPLSKRSGKCRRLIEMLEEVLATGDKALIFTQFRQMGHLLEAMIQHDLDTEVMFLHGGSVTKRRQQMIDRFQDPEGGAPIFILSLKAGGLGLNLTAANHVFHFDRWWNPAVENQATDRAFRIGQTRTVHVHKFVCIGTLEERIDQMIEQKTELAQNIIGAGEDWLTELSTGQLRELLTLRQTAMEIES